MTAFKNPLALAISLLGMLALTPAMADTITLSNGETLVMPVPADATTAVNAAVAASDASQADNLIQRLRAGFAMPDSSNPRMAQGRQWLSGKQQYVDKLLAKVSRYLYGSVTEAERRHLPTELALLPVIESSYDPMAVSRSQATGLWQFVPDTGRLYGLRQNTYYDARRDPVESTRAAYDYLARLYDTFQDWHLVLAAYNAGPGTVIRAIKRNQSLGLPTDYWSLRLPAETMNYVPRFLAVVEMFRNPASYGVVLNSIPNQPVFRTVNTDGPVTLSDIAALTGVETQVLRDLNPGLRSDMIDPQGTHQINVPAGLDALVEGRLNTRRGDATAVASTASATPTVITVADRSTQPVAAAVMPAVQTIAIPATYRVRTGDTWYSISRQFKVSVPDLLTANGNTPADPLTIGRDLRLPGGGGVAGNTGGSNVIPVVVSAGDGLRVDLKHHVVAGDTLQSVSRQYQVSLAELRAWNGDIQTLTPGQVLTLHVQPAQLNNTPL